MADLATSAQKTLIERLLRKAELDPRTITLMYRRVNVPERLIGRPLAEWLNPMEVPEASALIGRLKKLTEDDDSDE